MALLGKDWIDKYPQVKVLLQQEGEALEYPMEDEATVSGEGYYPGEEDRDRAAERALALQCTEGGPLVDRLGLDEINRRFQARVEQRAGLPPWAYVPREPPDLEEYADRLAALRDALPAGECEGIWGPYGDHGER